MPPLQPTPTDQSFADFANIRKRVFYPAVRRADELLAECDEVPLPQGLTPHKLRHTFASILVAIGWTPAM